MNTLIRYLFILLVFAGVSGCGDGFVPLRGKVTFSDDGSPVTTGFVYFDSGGKLARGKINADGTYIVGSLSDTDGLAPGNYKVYVQATGPDPSVAITASGLRPPVSLVDPKFSSAATSGLECQVDRSTKSYDIVVDWSPHLKRK
jgi:hypothetical protein